MIQIIFDPNYIYIIYIYDSLLFDQAEYLYLA